MAITIEEFLTASGVRLPDHYFTPARELKREEARNIVVHLVGAGSFKIREKVYEIRKGSPTLLSPRARITIAPPVIAGVKFVYIDSTSGWKKNIKYSYHERNLGLQDLRKVVFLYWLAVRLASEYGVTKIYHLGAGGSAAGTGYHQQGRAIDFGGVAGPDFDLTVHRNWYAQPVCMPIDWKDPNTGKTLAKGTRLAAWPTQFGQTNYRLDPSNNPYLEDDLNPELSRKIFQDVYDLAASEGQDTRGNASPPTTIGRQSRLIIHPDHHHSSANKKDKSTREAHHDHIHIQV